MRATLHCPDNHSSSPGPNGLLILLQFAGVGPEQAERSSGNAAKQVLPTPELPMPELRRQGSLVTGLQEDQRRPTGTLFQLNPRKHGR